MCADDLPVSPFFHEHEGRTATRDIRRAAALRHRRGPIVGVHDGCILVECAARWLMERKGHRFGTAHNAAQVIEELAFALETIRDMIEDLKIIVKRGDEGSEITLGGCGGDSLGDPA